ncbi:MAG: hypothetical protein ACKVY0_12980 [Prosthecobacter sp.]|uniref:hypothetical protein n=1 Tax=Prosthecobacter sp. TaxID=1965333 RepID=UPI0038FEE0A9
MRIFRPLFILLTATVSLTAQTPKPELISPQVKAAVEKAVAWLMRQQKSAGHIVDEKSDAKPKRGDLPSHSAAMTSLALMGLASVGHMPDDPTPEGQACGKALRFVVEGVEADENGYLGRSDRSRMYGHGIISLMLGEMIGHSPDDATDKRLRDQLKGAIQLIIRSQQVPKSEANRGGWRYEPSSSDSDISVSVWQVMALRAAKNAGFEVPKEAIDNAIAYIKRSYRVERDSNGNPKSDSAAFSYEPYGGRQTFSTTAAGLLSLQVCGQYEAPEVIGSAKWLLKSPPELNEPWFYYGCYYYAQGMYQRGGDHAATAREKTEKTLIAAQSQDGSWYPRNGNEKSAGAVYATSLALLSLSVHHHFLPIYQK